MATGYDSCAGCLSSASSTRADQTSTTSRWGHCCRRALMRALILRASRPLKLTCSSAARPTFGSRYRAIHHRGKERSGGGRAVTPVRSSGGGPPAADSASLAHHTRSSLQPRVVDSTRRVPGPCARSCAMSSQAATRERDRISRRSRLARMRCPTTKNKIPGAKTRAPARRKIKPTGTKIGAGRITNGTWYQRSEPARSAVTPQPLELALKLGIPGPRRYSIQCGSRGSHGGGSRTYGILHHVRCGTIPG
jgi:hypothetical protein